MRINNAKLFDNIAKYGSHSNKERLKQNGGDVQDKSAAKINNRPAERVSFSGSEHLNEHSNVSFTGDPKLLTKIARESLEKGADVVIPAWAEKFGGSNGFDKVIKNVHKNETFYEAIVALVVAGMLKPACVLAMPGAETEDKQMAATKNSVSAFLGFVLSSLILSPCSEGVNKVIKSFDSKDPTKYIKDAKWVEQLKSEDLLPGMKSTLGDAFKTGYKKVWDIGVSPMKAAITIALTPIVLKAIFGDKKKKDNKNPQENSLSQMAVMNSIRMDSDKKANSAQQVAPVQTFKGGVSFTGNKGIQQDAPSFTGGVSQVIELAEEAVPKKSILGAAKKAYENFLGEPIAKIIGKMASTNAGKKIVTGGAHFEKPAARWSDLTSIAITFFYIYNTWKSDKMEEDRKLPLMLNNGMVTIASSTAAFLIDKATDKPMKDIFKGYLKKHNATLFDKSNENIVKTLKTALETGADKSSLDNLTRHADDLLKNGLENVGENLKEAIEALKNNDIVKRAIKEKLIDAEDVAKIAASGFEKQATQAFGNISKAKSLTVFTFTVRFLVTVLMTPVVGKVVKLINKKLGKTPEKTDDNKKGNNADVPPAGSETIGIKDFMNGLNK